MVSHLELDDIESVEDITLEETYDLCVEGNHNYYLDCGKKILVHNSSKTTSIIQKFGIDSRNAIEPLQITICRLKMTWTRLSVLKDFGKFVSDNGIPIEPEFNPSRAIQEYMMFGSQWNFMGLDDTQRLPGMSHDKIWINEAMESSLNSFNQLDMRTSDEVVVDYNPMALNHWVYNLALRDEAKVIKSTILDNPYLNEGVRKTILGYQPTPENVRRGTADKYLWEVYGEGRKAVQKGRIFTKVSYSDKFPKDCKWVINGLDFGYTNDPTALVKIGLYEGKLYMKQLIYEVGLTNAPGPEGDTKNIHSRLKDLELDKNDLIIADSAEPKSIKELKKWGWNIKGAIKGPDSIRMGLDAVKRYEIVCVNSPDLKKELDNYKYIEDNSGELTNKPVDAFNHLIDPLRYGATRRIIVKRKTMHTTY